MRLGVFRSLSLAFHAWVCDLPPLKIDVKVVVAERVSPSQVTYLDLSGNNITQVHPGMDTMTALEVLRLNDNRLHELPAALFRCTCLIRLSVDNNAIERLPDSIGRCTRLTKLSMCNNRYMMPLSRAAGGPVVC